MSRTQDPDDGDEKAQPVIYSDRDTLRRFNRAKDRSQQRQDLGHLTHHEFLSLLLDAWEEQEQLMLGEDV